MDLLPWGVIRALVVALVLAAPLPLVWRRSKTQTITWAGAIIVASWLTAVTVVLIGDVPSRLLYWFDQVHAPLAERFSWLAWWENDFGGNPGYQVVADIVANSVQGIFFVAICAGAYFWGERHRKEGRFKS